MNTMKNKSWRLYLFLLIAGLMLQACGGGDGSGSKQQILSLNHAGYNNSTGSYQYGFNSISNIMITGQPNDLDWSRYAMLHDGTTYHLYFFKTGSNTILYQFGYNPNPAVFEYGYNSIRELTINGAPTDADPNSFAMLHDGADYRLYMRSIRNPTRIYQFTYNQTTTRYEYVYRSIPRLDVTGAPPM